MLTSDGKRLGCEWVADPTLTPRRTKVRAAKCQQNNSQNNFKIEDAPSCGPSNQIDLPPCRNHIKIDHMPICDMKTENMRRARTLTMQQRHLDALKPVDANCNSSSNLGPSWVTCATVIGKKSLRFQNKLVHPAKTQNELKHASQNVAGATLEFQYKKLLEKTDELTNENVVLSFFGEQYKWDATQHKYVVPFVPRLLARDQQPGTWDMTSSSLILVWLTADAELGSVNQMEPTSPPTTLIGCVSTDTCWDALMAMPYHARIFELAHRLRKKKPRRQSVRKKTTMLAETVV